ncbi:hypothetical protein ACE6H2_012794 [Prunus campanulata]
MEGGSPKGPRVLDSKPQVMIVWTKVYSPIQARWPGIERRIIHQDQNLESEEALSLSLCFGGGIQWDSSQENHSLRERLMMARVTTMVLKVDLQCHKCYKKVKKVLCKFPQIRDQLYDEKQNQVVIKVVCCSPEKIRDRICCKGRGTITRIEIQKEPEKPKPQTEDKPKPKPQTEDKPIVPAPENPPPNPPPPRVPVCHPMPYPGNVNACCIDCYHGHPGGPCQTGYGRVALYIQYDGYYGRPVYDSCGGCRSYNTNYCVARSDCFSEENPQGCTVM